MLYTFLFFATYIDCVFDGLAKFNGGRLPLSVATKLDSKFVWEMEMGKMSMGIHRLIAINQ